MNRWTPWCTSHYRHQFCLDKAKELRKSGKYEAVRVGYSIVEYDSRTGQMEKFSKVYLKPSGE